MTADMDVQCCRTGADVAQRADPAAFTILATACVAPRAAPRLLRTDPDVRLNDYAIALATWMDHPDPRIGDVVVFENSGFPPGTLAERVLRRAHVRRRQLEVITYRSPDRPAGTHYGYSEFQMIDDLMDRSQLLGTRFIKVTGRYRFRRISALLDRLPPRVRFVIDLQRLPAVPALGRGKNHLARTELLVAEREFYDAEIRRLYRRMRQAYRLATIEELLFDTLLPRQGEEGLYLRFPVNCEPSGFGGNGDDLDTLRRRAKVTLRGALRRTFPDLWL